MPVNTLSQRIQKVLAQAGHGSRREIEKWIAAGRISVNGKRAILGDRVNKQAKIRLDGRLLPLPDRSSTIPRILAYHKPAGEVTTRRDEKGRKTVFNSLPVLKNERWMTIGRLDITTSGLLLFTNDGHLANQLMHPSSKIEREYAVRVLGKVKPESLQRLSKGVKLDDGIARFEQIHAGGGEGANHWYHVVLKEGKNREVKRLFESEKITVSRLIRVRYGPYQLPKGLRAGSYRELKPHEVKKIIKAVS